MHLGDGLKIELVARPQCWGDGRQRTKTGFSDDGQEQGGGAERDGLPVDAGGRDGARGDARACAAGSPHVGAMPWAAVSVPVWWFESQMPKVLEKFRFVGRISKMA